MSSLASGRLITQAVRNKPTPPSRPTSRNPQAGRTKRTHRKGPALPKPPPARRRTPASENTKQTHHRATQSGSTVQAASHIAKRPQSPAPASAPPAQRYRVSRNTKHETRDTSESQSPTPQIFFPRAHNNLAPHHPQTTPKTLTRHATLQPRPVRIVHPINPAAPGQDSSRLLLR